MAQTSRVTAWHKLEKPTKAIDVTTNSRMLKPVDAISLI
jgi:hypothetical protein